MSRDGRSAWWGALVVATFAIIGGLVGLIVGASLVSGRSVSWGGLVAVLTGSSPSADLTAILGGWGFVAAGVLLGGYLAIFVSRLRHPGLVCPRCGTSNSTTARACVACDLELR
jgi:hypothetical protein